MTVIDLSQLPPPQIVDVPDFETLLSERKAEFVALFPAEEQEAVARTLALESEPVVKMLQEKCVPGVAAAPADLTRRRKP